MRNRASNNGVSVKAYAGTTGVLLGMNVEPRKREGLLGFAIERWDDRSGKREWLENLLPFPGMERKPGEPLPTNVAPVQKFRWSDYRVYPDTQYQYAVHPVYGNPAKPELEDGPAVVVRTAGLSGEHGVLFNRAAAASQAFSRKFPEVEEEIKAAKKAKRPSPPLPEKTLAWLSRGVLEQIIRLIEQAADPTWALDIAIYEYELEKIVQAVEAAHARGARVRVVYHAKDEDEQTAKNECNLTGLPPEAKRALERVEEMIRPCSRLACWSQVRTTVSRTHAAIAVNSVGSSEVWFPIRNSSM